MPSPFIVGVPLLGGTHAISIKSLHPWWIVIRQSRHLKLANPNLILIYKNLELVALKSTCH